MGIACLVGALELEDDPALASGSSSTESLVTPVFSARRVPEFLARPVGDRRLDAAIAPLSQQSPPQHCIMVSQAGAEAYGDNVDLPLMPASNQKIVTAAVAVAVLGKDTKFTTRAVVEVEPLNGIVNGPLYLVGGGDPLLSTDGFNRSLKYKDQPRSALETLADEVVAAGVTRINGGVVADESRLDSVRTVPSWSDNYLTDGEVGPLSAMSVNDARVLPGSQLGTFGSISATSPAQNPPVQAAEVFTSLLTARGVQVAKPAGAGEAPATSIQIAGLDSLPVGDIVGQMLRFSDNTTAELLMKEIGRTASGEGSTQAGIDATYAQLKKWKLDTEGIKIVDGSGLSKENRLTCRLLIDILVRDGPFGPIAGGLAVPRQSGTLRDRYAGSPAVDNVRAKTGTLSGASSLSGWVSTDAGVIAAFAFLTNTDGEIGQVVLERQEALTELMLRYPELPDLTLLDPEDPEGSG